MLAAVPATGTAARCLLECLPDPECQQKANVSEAKGHLPANMTRLLCHWCGSRVHHGWIPNSHVRTAQEQSTGRGMTWNCRVESTSFPAPAKLGTSPFWLMYMSVDV